MSHLRATSHYSSNHKGLLLAKDFKCIADFKECCKLIGWRVSTAHFKIGHQEKSNFDIIESYYAKTINNSANQR